MRRLGLFLVIAALTLFTGRPLFAQDEQPEGRVGIHQLSDADRSTDISDAMSTAVTPECDRTVLQTDLSSLNARAVVQEVKTLLLPNAEQPTRWVQYAELRYRPREPKSKIDSKGYAWLFQIVARTDTSTS